MNKLRIVISVILLLTSFSLAQKSGEQIRSEAKKNMQVNKLGEAIDLLNKYIAAYPQNVDGYNLRGICYERRGQFELALYDFRSARKVAPNNKEILTNLARAEDEFYKLLFNKIEGHKREIAINPAKPINYLEIGKSYKNMGQWLTAEDWYDKYLAREEASPDEIIRYTEILAKNNHIAKGEPILKRYCEKYPKDQRLWSRYGYFSMWLGKTQIAIKAFENALALKPYFKEAMDGLDMAKGKGYIYTFNDTSAFKNAQRGPKGKGKQPKQEYAIDKYYKMLKQNPEDIETRYKLIDELLKHERIEEAYQQLDFIRTDSSNERYQKYSTEVITIRDSLNQIKIAEYIEQLKKNPNDEKAIKEIATKYSAESNYDSSIAVIKNFLKDKPADKYPDLRFQLAKYQTWNYQYEDAISGLNNLLTQDPNNLDYKLLRAEIATWTDQDLDLAEGYLNDILNKDSKNVYALVNLASLKIRKDDFATAKDKLDLAKTISPDSKEVEAIENYYNSSLASYETAQVFKIKEEAWDLVANHDCNGALTKYDEYLSKNNSPTRTDLAEYADIVACSGDYTKSIDIYSKLLNEEYDYNVAVSRAKVRLMVRDSLVARDELIKLVQESPEDYEANLNLGVAYAETQEYENARTQFEKTKLLTSDSTKIDFINSQIAYLPTGSGSNFLSGFPNYIAIAPVLAFYRDNINFSLSQMGVRLNVGVTSFLAVGATFLRTTVKDSLNSIRMSTFKGNIFFRPIEELSISAGFGQLNSTEITKRNVSDASIIYEKKGLYNISLYYENTDSRLILYSPKLLKTTYDANMFKISGMYETKNNIKFSGYINNISVSDNNNGVDIQLRVGKKLNPTIYFGYEYWSINYSIQSKLYYSPKNFEAHSLWAEWNAAKEDDFKVDIGGKIGYIPSGDLLLREASVSAEYKPVPNFIINGKFTIGSTYRFESSYNYISAFLNAYWSFY